MCDREISAFLSARPRWRSLLKHSPTGRKAGLTPVTPCFCAFATPKTTLSCFRLLTTALHLEKVMKFVIKNRGKLIKKTSKIFNDSGLKNRAENRSKKALNQEDFYR